MQEHSLKSVINRKFTLRFLVIGLVLVLAVWGTLNWFFDKVIEENIYNMVISTLYSVLDNYDETLLAMEKSYDQLLTRLLTKFYSDMESPSQVFQEDYLANYLARELVGLDLYLELSDIDENLHYYIISPEGRIVQTNHASDLGLTLSSLPAFWQELTALPPGEVKMQRLSYELSTGIPRKYGYLKLDNGYILELGIPFNQSFYWQLLAMINELTSFSYVESIKLFDDNFINIGFEDYSLSIRDKEIFQSLASQNSYLIHHDDTSSAYYIHYTIDTLEGALIPQSYYIKLTFDFSSLLHLKNIIGLVIVLALVLTTLIFYFMNKNLAQEITAPFITLAESMTRLGQKDEITELNNSLEKTGIREVNILLASYQEMVSQLAATFDELKSTNEELGRAYQESNDLTSKLNDVIKVATRLTDAMFMRNKEKFLKELFWVARDFLPEADYGSLYVFDKNVGRYVEAAGHDLVKLQKLPLKKEYLIAGKDVNVVENILIRDNNLMPQWMVKELTEASKPIKSTLTIKLWVGEELKGGMSFDIAEGSEESFSQQSIEILKAFGNLASAFLTIQKYRSVHEKFQRELILAIINILEIHDKYTKGHSENVSRISGLIAEEMGLERDKIKEVEWAGLVHDIGKILVSHDILNKPAKLNKEEFLEIKKHPVWGYRVLSNSEELKDIALYVRYHHERWDGQGYPDGLVGEEIPLVSRILAVADAWDTMRSDRVYRPKLPLEEARRELRANQGKQFDPQVAEVALQLIDAGKLF